MCSQGFYQGKARKGALASEGRDNKTNTRLDQLLPSSTALIECPEQRGCMKVKLESSDVHEPCDA